MTALIHTISADGQRGWLTQDRLSVTPDGLILDEKIAVVRRLNLAVGGAGGGPRHDESLPVRWWHLDAAAALDADWSIADAADLPGVLPPMLRSLVDRHWTAAGRFMTLALGWSAREGRVVGWSFDSLEGYRPAELAAGATSTFSTTHPELESEESLARLRELYAAAKAGERVEELHRALAAHIARAITAGLITIVPAAIGGELDCATITAAGVEVRTIGRVEIPPQSKEVEAWVKQRVSPAKPPSASG